MINLYCLKIYSSLEGYSRPDDNGSSFSVENISGWDIFIVPVKLEVIWITEFKFLLITEQLLFTYPIFDASQQVYSSCFEVWTLTTVRVLKPFSYRCYLIAHELNFASERALHCFDDRLMSCRTTQSSC